MKKIAISVGDLNGIGLEIALKAHDEVKKLCTPIYCINEPMLLQGAKQLKMSVPYDFNIMSCGENFTITPSTPTAQSGQASFDSFKKALNLTHIKYADALVTLPINKEAWALANIAYKGHTDALEDILHQKAIMMLGCEELFVALFTHHIPLKDVASHIKSNKLKEFLVQFYHSCKKERIGVLGLNPHSGDNGVIGDEEKKIKKAIKKANEQLQKEVFFGPLVPDSAFSPRSLQDFNTLVALYHDQGLAPLKALYFEDSINVSLGLDVIRTSVDHGTAYDIAYKDKSPSLKSYINAINYALGAIDAKDI